MIFSQTTAARDWFELSSLVDHVLTSALFVGGGKSLLRQYDTVRTFSSSGNESLLASPGQRLRAYPERRRGSPQFVISPMTALARSPLLGLCWANKNCLHSLSLFSLDRPQQSKHTWMAFLLYATGSSWPRLPLPLPPPKPPKPSST